MNESMDDVKSLFRNPDAGAAKGIAVRVKELATNLLSTDGFFKSKDDTLQLTLKRIAKDQVTAQAKVDSFEKRTTARYNALDTQMSSLNALNAYIAQQVTTWNKSS
jgi:flagellar hook-associated protein 2